MSSVLETTLKQQWFGNSYSKLRWKVAIGNPRIDAMRAEFAVLPFVPYGDPKQPAKSIPVRVAKIRSIINVIAKPFPFFAQAI